MIDPQDIASDESGPEDPFPVLTAESAYGSDESLSDGGLIDDELGNLGGEDGDTAPVSPSPRKRISRLHSGPNWEKGSEAPREASSKPPSLDEWTSFFGKVVLKVTCDWYLSFAFRGIDEDMLSDRELDRLAMTDDERQVIAVPLAELSSKSKFMRKHGRSIVATGDALKAMVAIGAWMSRVNRIAAKYRPKNATIRVNGMNANGNSGQGTEPSGPSPYGAGTGIGGVSNGYRIYSPGSG